MKIDEVTIQVRVSDFAQGEAWYEKLLGRPPDFFPHAGFKEWELAPGAWLQVSEGTPAPGSGPLRLGVEDIRGERQRLMALLDVEISEIKRLPGTTAWCTFSDPFGNRLGLFQDLEKFPES